MKSNGTAAMASRCLPLRNRSWTIDAVSPKPIRTAMLVVEVPFTTAHPAQIEGRVATDLIGAATGIGAHNQRHAGNDVEADKALANSGPAGPHLVQLLWRELRGVEDGQPTVGQFPGKLQVLRPNRSKIDRDVLADRGDGQLQ